MIQIYLTIGIILAIIIFRLGSIEKDDTPSLLQLYLAFWLCILTWPIALIIIIVSTINVLTDDKKSN